MPNMALSSTRPGSADKGWKAAGMRPCHADKVASAMMHKQLTMCHTPGLDESLLIHLSDDDPCTATASRGTSLRGLSAAYASISVMVGWLSIPRSVLTRADDSAASKSIQHGDPEGDTIAVSVYRIACWLASEAD